MLAIDVLLFVYSIILIMSGEDGFIIWICAISSAFFIAKAFKKESK